MALALANKNRFGRSKMGISLLRTMSGKLEQKRLAVAQARVSLESKDGRSAERNVSGGMANALERGIAEQREQRDRNSVQESANSMTDYLAVTSNENTRQCMCCSCGQICLSRDAVTKKLEPPLVVLEALEDYFLDHPQGRDVQGFIEGVLFDPLGGIVRTRQSLRPAPGAVIQAKR